MLKRAVDILFSITGLLLFLPVMIAVAVAIKLESKGPVLFRQKRIGFRMEPFMLFKFRTMRQRLEAARYELTYGVDEARITRVGALLRKTKLDELPQLWNVLNGDMTFVGPRPQTVAFVSHFEDDYRAILADVHPGITDEASVKYRYEGEILKEMDDPINYYLRVVMPDKLHLQRQYKQKQSLAYDMWVIWRTVLSCFHSEHDAVMEHKRQMAQVSAGSESKQRAASA
jgi:lipopolysaccharide/colanic/teichoic acid biosynthesis glycosyltransferase